MEGLEDNNIKQTNSCCNKSKKKKVIKPVAKAHAVAPIVTVKKNKLFKYD
jgi:hypothetical protein